jgi:RimJ/RimL family protein N-acetyltransferase
MKKPQAKKNIIKKINSLNLSTERLQLTKLNSEDIESNVAHEMNPEIMRYIRDPSSYEKTLKKTIKVAKDYSGKEADWVLFAIRLKEYNAYVGMVCFRYESIENNTVEIGWRLGLEFHGKGYATEAAQAFLDFLKTEIKPHKVVAYCVKENTASSNIMTKLGMQQEACLREFSKLGGKWFDEAIYGLILD